MSVPDRPTPTGTTILSDGSRSSVSHVEAARVLGSEPTAAFAPTGASAERDFLAERLALFARIACLASSGFLLMLSFRASHAGRHGSPRPPSSRFPSRLGSSS